ncbi:MAG: signal peptide peptidase SppA [Acidobacteriota bacterium]|nr:signal peptide peptidase SppA [Acidobacteriota bacterium]
MSDTQPAQRRPVPPNQPPRRSILLPLLLVGGLGAFFFFIAMVIFIFAFAFPGEAPVKVTKGSVLVVDLRSGAPEYTVSSPFALFGEQKKPSLYDYLAAVDAARTDRRIAGILLKVAPGLGWAKAQEMRQALAEFRESGKWVVAHGQYWEEPEYYLASVADDVTMVPDSMLHLDGLQATATYYGDLLNKYGVSVHVEAYGEYKSYADSFQRGNMSEYDREATRNLLLRFESIFLDAVAESRGIPREAVKAVLDSAIYRVKEGEDKGLIDAAFYADELRKHLATRLTLDKPEQVNLVSVEDWMMQARSPGYGEAVAIIYGSGAIQGGTGRRGLFGDEVLSSGDFIEDLRAARKDKRVKAIVLRIDSPGGSLLASDVIWREIRLASEEGKPVYASMGNSAASGGYYMAMGCDRIFAMPATITGSIGVVTMRFSYEELYSNLNVGVDVVKTSPGADFFGNHRELTEAEAAEFSRRTRESYETFVRKAANARDVSFEELDRVARGRAWTGIDALEHGLVDELGGLTRAVEAAAEKAGLSNYSVIRYPLSESYFSMFSRDTLPLSKIQEPGLAQFIPPELRFLGDLVSRNKQSRSHTLAVAPYHLKID